MLVNIIPDTLLSNKGVNAFLTNINTYKNLASRFHLDLKSDKKIKIDKQHNIAYEILLKKNDVKFNLQYDNEINDLVRNELNICYPKATIKEYQNDYLKSFKIRNALEFELKNHYFQSLKVDKRGEFPLPQFLESSKMLRDGEQVLMQIILEPLEQEWYENVEEAIEDFNDKKMTERIQLFDKKKLSKQVAKFLYYADMEMLDLASLFLTNENYEYENLDEIEFKKIFRQGLSENTKKKVNYSAYNTSIRLVVDANKEREPLLTSIFRRCFNTLTEDNSLVERQLDKEKLFQAIKERKPIWSINKNILSTHELSQLIQLPTKAYQEQYHIKNIDTREIEIDKTFTQNGLQIGWTKYKGKKIPLYFPLNDVNSLCQCWLSIGKMGSGKTTNAENIAIQLLKQGYSVFAVDVADGNLVNHIQQGLPKDFPKDKIIDLDFGDTDNPIALNWCETAMIDNNRNMETKLASQLKNFLNKLSHTETSDRMERFLGACAKAVFKNPTANLYDVILCLTDRKYRDSIIKENKIEGRLLYTLKELDDDKKGSTGTKSQYVSFIMDRLEALLDNEYVANCLLQNPNLNINFRKWADEGYFVGIRVPKDTLLDDATDLLVTYIVSKLWLSILSRYNVAEKDRKPCFLMLDEPHQFPSVFKELYSIIREMRKWHFGIFVMAHEFGDFKSMKTLLKSAGTNYFIYSTSKDTYKELLEELAPFTLEEMLNTKWHSAIVNMRYKDKHICIMADMLRPLPKNDNYKPTNIYGRPLKQVEEEIYNKQPL